MTHDSRERLEKGEPTELSVYVPVYEHFPKPFFWGLISLFGLWFDNGDLDLKPERTLNQAFPEIKPLTVKELVNQAWKKN